MKENSLDIDSQSPNYEKENEYLKLTITILREKIEHLQNVQEDIQNTE